MPTPEEEVLWTKWLDEIMPPRPGQAADRPSDVARAEGLSGVKFVYATIAAEKATAEFAAIVASSPARRKRK